MSRAAFHAPEIAERAFQDYDALEPTVHTTFIPFQEALEALYDLVGSLEIPDNDP